MSSKIRKANHCNVKNIIMNNQLAKKEFDRKVCFSFFEDYRKTAKEIENDFGKEDVLDYYNAIIDYALYEIEPEIKGVLKYTWYTTKTTIDKSIERRSKGFGKEDTEKTDKVLEYVKDNPNATQREISEATGVSLGKVNNVLKEVNKECNSTTDANTYTNTIPTTNTLSDTNTYTVSCSITNTTSEREHEHDSHAEKKKTENKKRTLEDLSDEELRSIIEDYRKRIDYQSTRERLGLNRQITKNTSEEVESILKQREKINKEKIMKEKMISMNSEEMSKIAEYLDINIEEIQNASLEKITTEVDFEIEIKYFQYQIFLFSFLQLIISNLILKLS